MPATEPRQVLPLLDTSLEWGAQETRGQWGGGLTDRVSEQALSQVSSLSSLFIFQPFFSACGATIHASAEVLLGLLYIPPWYMLLSLRRTLSF